MYLESNSRTQSDLDELALSARPIYNTPPEWNWTFYNTENPHSGIRSLHLAFSKLRADIPGGAATFLDCGSGNGVAALVAYFADFDRVKGIEINESLVNIATERAKHFVKRKGMSNDSVQYAHGSYYQLDILEDIVGRCKKELLLRYADEGTEESCDFADYTNAVLGMNECMSVDESIAKYITSKNTNAYRDLGIVSGGTLTADVVYIYPSDIFFECAFLPQMSLFMKKGSLLSVLNPVDDCVRKSPPGFCERERVALPDCSYADMCLQIFQKVAE